MSELISLDKPVDGFTLDLDCELSQGLRGWWPGIEQCGLRIGDMSGRNNFGTFSSTSPPVYPTWSPAYQGGLNALKTTNVSYVDCGQVITNTIRQMTISFLYTSVSGSVVSIGWDDTFSGYAAVLVQISGALYWALQNTGSNNYQCTAPLFVNRTRITATWDAVNLVAGASTCQVWFNDKKQTPISSFGHPLTWFNNTQVFRIGRDTRNNVIGGGVYEDVAVWDRCLPDGQIKSLVADPWQLRFVLGRKSYGFFGGSAGFPVVDPAYLIGIESVMAL